MTLILGSARGRSTSDRIHAYWVLDGVPRWGGVWLAKLRAYVDKDFDSLVSNTNSLCSMRHLQPTHRLAPNNPHPLTRILIQSSKQT